MKKTYEKPSVVVNGEFVRETETVLHFDKPHWPYPEGQVYAYSPF